MVSGEQRVDLVPETFFVDAEFLEKRLLHVAGDKGFVEIPDAGDNVLRVKACFH